MLARLRFPSECSRLRRYSEQGVADAYRGPFQHDRDRIIHSRAFRRLAGKTQVATLPDSNHCRTRLTHTIEVSQIARSVGSALGLNVDLVEALALAHDLGHPAFGHVGESALDREMRRHGFSFDHNFHALRIVEHFERRYVAFRGLNLTFEVREGLLKHSRDLDPKEPSHREYLPELQPTLEAQLIDSADAIAYLSADLEDAVEGEYLDLAMACDRVPSFAAILARIRDRYPGATDRRALTETLRQLVGEMVDGLIQGTVTVANESGVGDWREVREASLRIATPLESTSATMMQIRAVLTECYYDAPSVREVTGQHAGRLSELFLYYLENPSALPSDSVDQLDSEPLPRVVCDYIAGMTDEYLLRCYDIAFSSGTVRQFRRVSA